jgi:hypothetical protein
MTLRPMWLLRLEAVFLLAGGLFLVAGGMSGCTFARRYSDRPPPVMWRESPTWSAVLIGSAMFSFGVIRWKAAKK